MAEGESEIIIRRRRMRKRLRSYSRMNTIVRVGKRRMNHRIRLSR